MAGYYIHIPFCKEKCIYCNFHFSTQLQSKDAVIEAILREMELRRDYIGGERVETIYFGGGTPSLLTKEELASLLAQVRRLHDVNPEAEITLEANPDDLSAEKLRELYSLGINRLSIGVQSFREEDILFLKRAHTAGQARRCIEDAQAAGFRNMTIDLIYGIPGQSDEDWLQNLQTVKELGIPHLSCYALTVEPRTELDHLVRKKKLTQVDDEQTARHFHLLGDWAEANDFRHYEISNLSLPGLHARHNSSYWHGAKYIGIGPSAHSFDGATRQWNVANNFKYAEGVKKGGEYYEVETLSPVDRYNEYLMTSLRLAEGCDISAVENIFGEEKKAYLLQAAEPFIKKGWMENKEDKLVMTRAGKLMLDGVLGEMFFV